MAKPALQQMSLESAWGANEPEIAAGCHRCRKAIACRCGLSADEAQPASWRSFRAPTIVTRRPVGGTATNLGLSSIALINLSRAVAFLPAAAYDEGDGTESDGSQMERAPGSCSDGLQAIIPFAAPTPAAWQSSPPTAAPRRASADLVAERCDAAICPESGEKRKRAACA